MSGERRNSTANQVTSVNGLKMLFTKRKESPATPVRAGNKRLNHQSTPGHNRRHIDGENMKRLTYSEEELEDTVHTHFHESEQDHNQEVTIPLSAITDIVQQTVDKLLPAIIESVKTAVDAGHNKQVEEIREVIDRDRILRQIAQEKAEQYSRRENMRVLGVKEAEGENEDELVKVVTDIGLAIDAPIEGKISTVHRVGKRGEKPRALIVRFAVRRDRDRMMKNKKKLKDNETITKDPRFQNKVTLLDDLTEPRRKLLRTVQEYQETDYAYIRDGVIVCKLRNGRFYRINSADDLFQIGFSDICYQDIYGME